jgi:hypothetical protein
MIVSYCCEFWKVAIYHAIHFGKKTLIANSVDHGPRKQGKGASHRLEQPRWLWVLFGPYARPPTARVPEVKC